MIENNPIDAVFNFKYLGNMVDNEGRINTTVCHRIKIGNSAHDASSRALRSRLIGHITKMKTYSVDQSSFTEVKRGHRQKMEKET